MTPVPFLPGMTRDARPFCPRITALSGRWPVMVAPMGGAGSMAALVLCARHDTLCPAERRILMRTLLAHGRLELVENAGRLPTPEQPELTDAARIRWLED